MKIIPNHLEKNSFKFWQIYLSLFSGYFPTNSRENYFDEGTDVHGYTFMETLSRVEGKDYLKTISVYQDASTKKFIIKRLQYKRKNIFYAQLKNEANIIYLFSNKATEGPLPRVRFCQFVDFYEKKGDTYLIREFVSGDTLDKISEAEKLDYLKKCFTFLSIAKNSLTEKNRESIALRSNWLMIGSLPVYFMLALLKEVNLWKSLVISMVTFFRSFPYNTLFFPNYILTHRDLHLQNAIFTGDEVVIIDPEICVFAEDGMELAMAAVSYKENNGDTFLNLLLDRALSSGKNKKKFLAFSSYYILQELTLSKKGTDSYLNIKRYMATFNDTVESLSKASPRD